MRDITLCNEGTPKKLKNGLYNFSKLRTLVMMVSDSAEKTGFFFYQAFPSLSSSLRTLDSIRDRSSTSHLMNEPRTSA